MKVIFRKFKDGEVIALLPEILGTREINTCVTYAHNGQHGTADIFEVIKATKPATPKEYIALKRELRIVGYISIEVVKRNHKAFTLKRMEHWI